MQFRLARISLVHEVKTKYFKRTKNKIPPIGECSASPDSSREIHRNSQTREEKKKKTIDY